MSSTPTDAPTPSPSDQPGQSVTAAGAVAAMQSALAGEHAAVYAYGVVGALLDDDDRDTADKYRTDHMSRRDELREMVRSNDATPVAAHAAYQLPFEVNDTDTARELAAEIERRLTDVYADLVATTLSEKARKLGAAGLARSARRVAVWSGEVAAFPGLENRPETPVVTSERR